MPSEYEEICGDVLAETAKAFLLYDGTKEVWVPKSQIDPDHLDEIEVNKTVSVYVKTWFAEKEGLL